MNVVPFPVRCANRTCTRTPPSNTPYCSDRCRIAELAGDGRSPIEIRIGQDELRRIVQLAAEYGATVPDVVNLVLEAEFGEELA